MNKEKINTLIDFGQNLNVLYVEDNEEAREATLDVLRDFFPNIHVAHDGQEGLELWGAQRFDLIITDINMPRLNGIEMVETIRKTDLDTPILITSAYSDPGYFMETIKLGVEGYLLKPIDLKQFVDVLSKVLEKVRLKKENDLYKKTLEDENLTLTKSIKHTTEQLKEQIFIDNLTGLKNRAALDMDISNYVEEGETSLILIDINNFKGFNSLYGLDTGNLILQTFANILKEYAKQKGYQVYRTSADEFALFRVGKEFCFEKIHGDISDLLELVDEIKIKKDDDAIMINTTMGVALQDGNLFNKASISLDEAKRNNKKFVIYDNSLDTTAELKELFKWQQEIKSALEEDRIVPFFQPIFDKDRKILKYEALMRMRKRDTNEYITPFFFLDISVKTKQYDAVAQMMIAKVLDVARQNKDKIFSINLSYSDIKNSVIKEMFIAYVKQTLEAGQRCNLVFEIVESQDIDNYKNLKMFFDTFKCSDIKIAVDDFGSGYSNFTQILSIMPEYIKIDGSLIKDIDHNIQSLALVKAIISFAKRLSIKTIAEFVHNEEIFEILKDEGIDQFQGFYLAEPSKDLMQ
jgi:diguanylate cyclase (GGDEF)-like protein